jgi:AraC-like DNA-binding protein
MSLVAENFFRYLPVSQRELRFGLYVTGVGCTGVRPASRYPPCVHPAPYQFTWENGRVLPEYQVGYIARGEGVFESSVTGSRRIRGGTTVLLFPGVWHRVRPSATSGWDEFWVGISGEYLNRLAREGFICPERPLIEIGADQAMLEPYLSLIERVRRAPQGYAQLIAADAMEILALTLAALPPEPAGETSPSQGVASARAVEDRMVAEAIEIIWDHTNRSMTVDDVASRLPITRRSLERRFRRLLGHTIFEEITRCRLVRAEQLLAETKVPIEQVAVRAGFSSPERMCKVFHRLKGLSPLAYRRQQQDF